MVSLKKYFTAIRKACNKSTGTKQMNTVNSLKTMELCLTRRRLLMDYIADHVFTQLRILIIQIYSG